MSQRPATFVFGKKEKAAKKVGSRRRRAPRQPALLSKLIYNQNKRDKDQPGRALPALVTAPGQAGDPVLIAYYDPFHKARRLLYGPFETEDDAYAIVAAAALGRMVTPGFLHGASGVGSGGLCRKPESDFDYIIKRRLPDVDLATGQCVQQSQLLFVKYYLSMNDPTVGHVRYLQRMAFSPDASPYCHALVSALPPASAEGEDADAMVIDYNSDDDSSRGPAAEAADDTFGPKPSGRLTKPGDPIPAVDWDALRKQDNACFLNLAMFAVTPRELNALFKRSQPWGATRTYEAFALSIAAQIALGMIDSPSALERQFFVGHFRPARDHSPCSTRWLNPVRARCCDLSVLGESVTGRNLIRFVLRNWPAFQRAFRAWCAGGAISDAIHMAVGPIPCESRRISDMHPTYIQDVIDRLIAYTDSDTWYNALNTGTERARKTQPGWLQHRAADTLGMEETSIYACSARPPFPARGDDDDDDGETGSRESDASVSDDDRQEDEEVACAPEPEYRPGPARGCVIYYGASCLPPNPGPYLPGIRPDCAGVILGCGLTYGECRAELHAALRNGDFVAAHLAGAELLRGARTAVSQANLGQFVCFLLASPWAVVAAHILDIGAGNGPTGAVECRILAICGALANRVIHSLPERLRQQRTVADSESWAAFWYSLHVLWARVCYASTVLAGDIEGLPSDWIDVDRFFEEGYRIGHPAYSGDDGDADRLPSTDALAALCLVYGSIQAVGQYRLRATTLKPGATEQTFSSLGADYMHRSYVRDVRAASIEQWLDAVEAGSRGAAPAPLDSITHYIVAGSPLPDTSDNFHEVALECRAVVQVTNGYYDFVPSASCRGEVMQTGVL